MKTPTILSLSFSPEKLKRREDALQEHGFQVKSVFSPGQARFEIEMGQCGVFVTCDSVPEIVNQDLMNLFRQFCPKEGLIIYFERPNPLAHSVYPPPADIRLPESADPDGIVDALRSQGSAQPIAFSEKLLG